MTDLDRILMQQLRCAKRRLKTVKRLIKIMPDDPQLPIVFQQIEKKITFFESMISVPKKQRKYIDINIRRTWSTLVYSVRFYKFFLRRNNK